MKIKMRQQFADSMLEIGQKDPQLVVLVGDISHYALQPFAKACPGRFYNVGICEPTIMSMAAGLSKVGLRPVVHTIAPFLIERAFEQIKLDFCYQDLPGNIITVGSAFDYGALGCSHHCYDDFALLKPLPKTQITYPSTPIEFTELFGQTYQNNFVTYFRLPEAQHHVEFKASDIRIGKGVKVADGMDVTIVATGPQLSQALGARDLLHKRGVRAEVIYIHTVKPFDQELVRASVSKTKRVMVIEEHSQYGGVGDEVMRACRDIPGVQYAFQSLNDEWIHEYGTYEEHCRRLGFTAENVAVRIWREIFKKLECAS